MLEGYLCVMLDCSRNAVMSVDGLKAFIDKLSVMGYNALQLYTEDTYEIKEEPLFGYMRGRYTQDELKELDAYAKERGIELIPCIQTLGHLDQLFPWKRFRSMQDIYNILLVGEEETYGLIENMFKACAECFTSRRINIGMDEAHMLGLGKYLDKHGYQPRSEILLAHLKRVCAIAEKYAFKPMMWSDMFFKLADDLGGHNENCAIPKEVLEKVPENIELVYWDYSATDIDHYKALINKHREFNRNVWYAGCVKTGRTYHAQNELFQNAQTASLTACKETGLKNVLITIWGDFGNECPTAAILPSLVRVAAVYHGRNDYKELFAEITGENYDDFLLTDMKMPTDFPKATQFSTGAKTMLYSDPFLGRYDSMVFGDGRERKAFAEKAKEFAAAKIRAKSYAYLFAFYQKLCEILAVKYDLGYLTRQYYQKDDKNGLQSLLSDYQTLVPMLEEFIELARTAWCKENKPHGFDVIELRLAGATQRVKSCGRRLKDYLDGRTERIPELEEKLVFDDSDTALNRKMTDVHNYSFIATVNRV